MRAARPHHVYLVFAVAKDAAEAKAKAPVAPTVTRAATAKRAIQTISRARRIVTPRSPTVVLALLVLNAPPTAAAARTAAETKVRAQAALIVTTRARAQNAAVITILTKIPVRKKKRKMK